jgi:hypothetical protein
MTMTATTNAHSRSRVVARGARPEGRVLCTDPESRVPRAAAGDGGAGLRPAGAVAGRECECC